ncbi:MAG: YdbL family protein [Proteobacteria bacterium]|nr:DUF1318 domain-containing protein [Desulfobulbaceae bacterium]MBU4152719.1 YdbL family protein [Pseudomonadota bacterium]MDP2105750.1 DUF1318 domain-containing protein [Desulfobulbaceae bacterium]
MTRRNLAQLMTILLVLIMAVGTAMAADGIKDRMLARVPVLNTLKATGVIGENNKGYLELIGNKNANTAEMNAENADRRQVYEAIAKQQGTSADLVGKRRALQIADSAALGTWLQAVDGSWRQQ